MKLKIIDTNRGQLPKTINEALSYSQVSRKQIEKYLETNDSYWVIYRGYNYKIGKKEEI